MTFVGVVAETGEEVREITGGGVMDADRADGNGGLGFTSSKSATSRSGTRIWTGIRLRRGYGIDSPRIFKQCG